MQTVRQRRAFGAGKPKQEAGLPVNTEVIFNYGTRGTIVGQTGARYAIRLPDGQVKQFMPSQFRKA